MNKAMCTKEIIRSLWVIPEIRTFIEILVNDIKIYTNDQYMFQ